MKSASGIKTVFVAAFLAAIAPACAVEPEDDEVDGTTQLVLDVDVVPAGEGDIDQGDADVTMALVESWRATCEGEQAGYAYLNGVFGIDWATASRCRRQNGTWTGFVSWNAGVCTGNLSNNNGVLVCGP